MRTLALFLFVSITGLACAGSPDYTITAADIAMHLGIHKWAIPAANLPRKGTVFIRKIENGRVGIVLSAIKFTDSPADIVICDHIEGTEDYVTITHDGATTAWHGPIGRSSLTFSPGVPPEYPAHTYILWADYRHEGIRVDITGKVEDMIAGLALTILADEPGNKSVPLPER